MKRRESTIIQYQICASFDHYNAVTFKIRYTQTNKQTNRTTTATSRTCELRVNYLSWCYHSFEIYRNIPMDTCLYLLTHSH